MQIDKGHDLHSIGELMAVAAATADEVEAAATRLKIQADLALNGVLMISAPKFAALAEEIARARLARVAQEYEAEQIAKTTRSQRSN